MFHVWCRVLRLALLLGALACSPASQRAERVVLISIDTLRADRLNCYGYVERELSPHIDALARDGILFENHISSAPWTIPAHLSLMTSLHPTTHDVTQLLVSLKRGHSTHYGGGRNSRNA